MDGMAQLLETGSVERVENTETQHIHWSIAYRRPDGQWNRARLCDCPQAESSTTVRVLGQHCTQNALEVIWELRIIDARGYTRRALLHAEPIPRDDNHGPGHEHDSSSSSNETAYESHGNAHGARGQGAVVIDLTQEDDREEQDHRQEEVVIDLTGEDDEDDEYESE